MALHLDNLTFLGWYLMYYKSQDVFLFNIFFLAWHAISWCLSHMNLYHSHKHMFILSCHKYVASVIYAVCTKTIWRYNSSPSIHDWQNGDHFYSIYTVSKRRFNPSCFLMYTPTIYTLFYGDHFYSIYTVSKKRDLIPLLHYAHTNNIHSFFNQMKQ